MNEKERLLYGPMAGVGGLIYDKDAIYIQTTERQKKNEVSKILYNVFTALNYTVCVQKVCTVAVACKF